MGLSQLEICNQALLKVGADVIDTLTPPASTEDGTKRSIELCNIFFDQSYEEVLRMYPWNSAKKRAEIDLTDNPDFGYEKRGELPADFIRLVDIFRYEDQRDQRTAWVVEAGYILSDYDTLYMKYIAKPLTTELDPLATNAVICNLAMKLCTALQLDDNWAKRINDELFGIILPQARSIDTFENKELLLEESSWLLNRELNHPVV